MASPSQHVPEKRSPQVRVLDFTYKVWPYVVETYRCDNCDNENPYEDEFYTDLDIDGTYYDHLCDGCHDEMRIYCEWCDEYIQSIVVYCETTAYEVCADCSPTMHREHGLSFCKDCALKFGDGKPLASTPVFTPFTTKVEVTNESNS
jgi:hypothetical protein